MRLRAEHIFENKHQDSTEITAKVTEGRISIEQSKETLRGYQKPVTTAFMAYLDDLPEETLKSKDGFSQAIDDFKIERLPELIQEQKDKLQKTIINNQ